MKKPKTLEEMTHHDILMGIILFRKDKNPNFKIEELRDGLKKAFEKYPILGEIKDRTLDNLFFFQQRYLSGEMNLPHYRLCEEGEKVFRYHLLDRNNEVVLKYLEEVAEEVWSK